MLSHRNILSNAYGGLQTAEVFPDDRLFVGLGLPLLQGYGLTETSPVISVNRLRANVPDSVERALPNVEVRIGESEELQVRAPSVMLGYWRRPAASAAIADGWLHTGDQARLDAGYSDITGGLKRVKKLRVVAAARDSNGMPRRSAMRSATWRT